MDTKQLNKGAALSVLFAGVLSLLALGCTFYGRHDLQANAVQKEDISSLMQVSDDQLMSLVTRIAAGSDKTSSDALNALNTYHVEQLADRFQKILLTLPYDDHRRVSVAFVLCLLNYDYENNKNVIVRELGKKPHHKNPYADWEAELVHRLILRGDSQLLSTLFKVSTWADGAMAAALSGYLTHHLQNQFEQFLNELRREPRETRREVYKRVLRDELMTKEELTSTMQRLDSVPQTSPVFDLAREMLLALREAQ